MSRFAHGRTSSFYVRQFYAVVLVYFSLFKTLRKIVFHFLSSFDIFVHSLLDAASIPELDVFTKAYQLAFAVLLRPRKYDLNIP